MSHASFAAAHPSLAEARRNLLIGIISFLTLVDLFAAQAILPALTKLYEATPAAMGAAVNASTFGMAAAGIAVAVIGGRIDKHRGIWLSLSALSVPTILLAFCGSIESFAVLRVLQGIFMSAAFTLTMAYLAEGCDKRQAAAAMAAYVTGNVASNLLGRLLSANMVDRFDVETTFFVFAALNIGGAVVAYFGLERAIPIGRNSEAPKIAQVFKAHLANPALQAIFAIGFLILFAFLGIFTFVNFVLVAAPFSLSAAQLGLVYFVFLPSIFTTPTAASLAGKLGARRAFWLALAVAGLGLILVLSSTLAIMLAGLALVAIGTFLAQAEATGFVGRAATSDRAAASGLYLSSYYIGGLAGSLILGQVYAVYGWAGCVSGVAIALALAALLGARLRF